MGRQRSYERGRLHRSRTDEAYAAWAVVQQHLKSLIDRRDWSGYRRQYIAALPLLLFRVKMGTETWIKKLWLRLVRQWNECSISELVMKITRAMQDSGSCIYRVFNFNSSSCYVGLVEDRGAALRFTEHLSELQRPAQSDDVHKMMKRRAAPAEWMMLPISSSEMALPKRQLEKLEEDEIRQTRSCINNTSQQYKPKLARRTAAPPAQSQSVAKMQTKVFSPRILMLESWSVSDDGQLVDEPDVIALFKSSRCFIVHTSRLRLTALTTVQRLYRKSTILTISQGFLWICMDFRTFPQIPIDLHGFP